MCLRAHIQINLKDLSLYVCVYTRIYIYIYYIILYYIILYDIILYYVILYYGIVYYVIYICAYAPPLDPYSVGPLT